MDSGRWILDTSCFITFSNSIVQYFTRKGHYFPLILNDYEGASVPLSVLSGTAKSSFYDRAAPDSYADCYCTEHFQYTQFCTHICRSIISSPLHRCAYQQVLVLVDIHILGVDDGDIRLYPFPPDNICYNGGKWFALVSDYFQLANDITMFALIEQSGAAYLEKFERDYPALCGNMKSLPAASQIIIRLTGGRIAVYLRCGVVFVLGTHLDVPLVESEKFLSPTWSIAARWWTLHGHHEEFLEFGPVIRALGIGSYDDIRDGFEEVYWT